MGNKMSPILINAILDVLRESEGEIVTHEEIAEACGGGCCTKSAVAYVSAMRRFNHVPHGYTIRTMYKQGYLYQRTDAEEKVKVKSEDVSDYAPKHRGDLLLDRLRKFHPEYDTQ